MHNQYLATAQAKEKIFTTPGQAGYPLPDDTGAKFLNR